LKERRWKKVMKKERRRQEENEGDEMEKYYEGE
jgi:hypothetical protein